MKISFFIKTFNQYILINRLINSFLTLIHYTITDILL